MNAERTLCLLFWEGSEMIEFCEQQMATYKYPRPIQFVHDLPKTATREILRRELRGLNS